MARQINQDQFAREEGWKKKFMRLAILRSFCSGSRRGRILEIQAEGWYASIKYLRAM